MELAQNETIPEMEVTHHNFTEMIATALNLIGMAANVMIISTILSVKSLQTRPYLLLINWSIFDILFKISTDKYLHYVIEKIPIKQEMQCIVRSLDMIFLFAEIIFMLALISNWALKSYRMSDLVILFIFYSIILSCLVTVLALCMYKVINDLVHGLAGISYLVLLIAVIAKGVNKLRKAMSDPLSPETAKWLNVASIYTYSMLLLFVTVLSVYHYRLFFLIDFVVFTMILIPCFVLLYLTHADEVYKASFLGLIFCRQNVDYPTVNVNSHNEFQF